MLQSVRRHSAVLLTVTINSMKEIHPVTYILFKLNHIWLIFVPGEIIFSVVNLELTKSFMQPGAQKQMRKPERKGSWCKYTPTPSSSLEPLSMTQGTKIMVLRIAELHTSEVACCLKRPRTQLVRVTPVGPTGSICISQESTRSTFLPFSGVTNRPSVM
jgi:hypothetical protein